VTRLYWAACGVLIGTGLLGIVLVCLFPPEYFDSDGRLIGEMPPEFAASLALAFFGLLGALAGGVALGAARLCRWRRDKARSVSGTASPSRVAGLLKRRSLEH